MLLVNLFLNIKSDKKWINNEATNSFNYISYFLTK